MALTCAYADGLPEVTPDAMESAIKELQWPSYAERIERHRLKARSAAPADNGVVEILREQSAVLAAIAGQGEKVEHLASALESIGRSLAAIELHLRNLVPKQGAELRWESTIDRRKKTG
jgi:phage I-like protein